MTSHCSLLSKPSRPCIAKAQCAQYGVRISIMSGQYCLVRYLAAQVQQPITGALGRIRERPDPAQDGRLETGDGGEMPTC